MKLEKKDLFIQKIQKTFGNRHIRILQHLYTKPPVTFRVNTSKISDSDALVILKKDGFLIRPGPIKNSYIVENNPHNLKLSETALFNTGKIYIQKLSSMLPALMLEAQEGDKILDMCAAPGSKTSQIADLTQDKSEITAVDNNKKRIYKLKSNLETQGFSNVTILYANAAGLEKKYKNFVNHFDKVLLDAPCSNEGLICLSDPNTFDYWDPKTPKRISNLQKKLVTSAINMIKPKGILVYSTCTFSKEENEDIVSWALKKFPNMSLLEVKKVLPDGLFTAFFSAKFTKTG